MDCLGRVILLLAVATGCMAGSTSYYGYHSKYGYRPPKGYKPYKPFTYADVVFAYDDSGSIGADANYLAMKDFMKSVVNAFSNVGVFGMQYGAACFAQDVVNHFHLNEYSSASDVNDAIDAFDYRKGHATAIGLVLQHIRQVMFLNSNRNIPPRWGAHKIVILLTDGRNNRDPEPIPQAELLKQQGTIIICIGVGNNINLAELQGIASHPSFVFTIADFRGLSGLLQRIYILITRAIISGPFGRPGKPGAPGSPGQPGDTGKQGPEGHIGKPGEEGEVGDQGPPGPAGEPGDKGPRGPRGVDGHYGRPGKVGDRGPKGPKGDKGDPGPNGKNGNPGTPGEDGDPGPQGPPGPKGDDGIVGTQCPIGADGPPGPPGPRGPNGPQGDKGPKGPKGDDGDKGPPGPKCPKRYYGIRGPPGPKGYKGPVGLPGFSGDVFISIEYGGCFNIVKQVPKPLTYIGANLIYSKGYF